MWWTLWLLACSQTAPMPCEPPGTQVAHARAAGCFVVVDQRLLLIRGSAGWSIPGGYVDGDEAPSVAAERETFEEAGLRVRALVPRCAVSEKGFVAYTCEPTGPLTLQPDGRETTDAQFVDAATLRALPDADLRFPAQRAAYEQALP